MIEYTQTSNWPLSSLVSIFCLAYLLTLLFYTKKTGSTYSSILFFILSSVSLTLIYIYCNQLFQAEIVPFEAHLIFDQVTTPIELLSLSFLKPLVPVREGNQNVSTQVNHPFFTAFKNFKLDHQTKYTLIAGIGSTAKSIQKQFYNCHDSSYKIKGFVKCKDEACAVQQENIVSNLAQFKDYLKDNTVDEIVIALPVKTSKKVKRIIETADYYGIRVKYIPDYENLFGKNYKATRVGSLDIVNVRQTPLDETWAFLLKNTFDKLFAFAAIMLLTPVLLVVAALIKLDSPGPLLYCPIRIGKSGKPFKVFKFRSMRENDSAQGGTLSTRENDDRITKIGRILRKYSLDELPQFFNVLLGDMSVVGPRPHRSFLNQQLQQTEDKYMVRHYFKPGITGWAQVNGWRGPTDTKEQKNQRTSHDLWYVENWSLWLDIKIIYMTIFGKSTHKNVF
ncbi:exopolysaccharide biosynthesis polyprenyl glycosylphosphotransferase [Nibribacter ruber]|uniref:exopolysaccharide biosynthesis polyprenyl glycosylphosphotransferase n=1 Tax=Nibribacter ruber TaxID=2698458 RepID=UPI001E5103D5|nr:exopolysaccharide biosynthesis polyprenyl glycosylphosphotransferase [Nibribacter ruber]